MTRPHDSQPGQVDPLAGSSWSDPAMVAGFSRSSPNLVLMRFAAETLQRRGRGCAVDIGCGAGRNAVPLARSGWAVLGTDLSWPMLSAARQRGNDAGAAGGLQFVLAPMESLPLRDRCADLVVAHGIWNLAQSSAQFRRAVREAARIAKPGARLFVFTFSRATLPADAAPFAGEPFVFTQFSGEPQCFLTDAQLLAELADAGWAPDAAVPLTEYNKPAPGEARARGPVIYEAAFRRT